MLVRCLNMLVAISLGLTLLATPLSAAPITGGTGPGGIGTTNGASSLITWLRADLGIATANAVNKVSGWADQSGKNFHGTQTILGVQPDFVSGVSSGYNNRPIVRVDGTQYLKLGVTHAASNYTFFFAIDPANTQPSSTLSYLFDNDTQRMIPAFHGNQTRPGFFDAANVWRETTATVTTLVTSQLLSYTFNNSGGGSIVRNGTNLPMVNNTYTQQSLGLSSGGAGLPRWVGPNFAGDYAEMAIFDTALTSSQRTIVENYMSGRYGLAIANDRYDGDTVHGYEEDIFGVGSTGTGAAWTNSGSHGFGIEATLVDASDWLLAGHDATTNSIVDFESTNDLIGSRWDRVWYVDKTGALDATLAFDFEDAGLTLPGPGSTFQLLYSADSNFSDGWQIKAQTNSISNGTVAFSLANAALLEGFYTLGINIQVPEPTSLTLLSGAFGCVLLRRRSLKRRERENASTP
jgi:hypothetical protein